MAQLLSNLPIGSLIKFGKHQVGSETAQPIIWRVVDKNHNGYPSNSVTLITDKIIDIRVYDEREDDNPWGNINYGVSNINQWLNSEGGANNWYRNMHGGDKPPFYTSRPGFLYNFTPDERLALLSTTLTTQVVANVSGSIVAKVFLPSVWELRGSHTYADGSSRFADFASSSTAAYITTQLYTNVAAGDRPTNSTDPWAYLTRSTSSNTSSGATYVVCITNSGNTTTINARDGGKGVRPCANLSANTKISDAVDSDGCYTVLFNSSPVISGANSNLGNKTSDFAQTYTINDADNEPVTVTEYIDNVKLRSYVATLNATNTFDITGKTWLKLTNGAHTLKIVATDGFAEVVRTYTFIKSVTKLVAQRSTPLDSTTMPKSIMVTVVKVIPDGAIFKVEACNNGYDASPTWEDITTRVLQGRIYDFTNTAKTATKWGVNIRVTIDRNGSEGACYITEIGGNFE